jgi:two-component system, LytTR family, response regulator AlgR
MKQARILIVDDEPLARTRLRQLIEAMDDYVVAGEAQDGLQAIRMVATDKIDIILLDIRMPGMDGLEVGKHLAGLDRAPAIIFTTAYSEHALDAFQSHAVDYLLKPVRADKLSAALQAAHRISRVQMQQLDGDIDSGKRTHICARVRGDLQLININDIYFFRADSKYVEVRHKGGSVLIEEALVSLEKEFADEFIRVHRNALVAPSFLHELKKDEHGHSHLGLRGISDTIEVSRRHLPGVRALLKG